MSALRLPCLSLPIALVSPRIDFPASGVVRDGDVKPGRRMGSSLLCDRQCGGCPGLEDCFSVRKKEEVICWWGCGVGNHVGVFVLLCIASMSTFQDKEWFTCFFTSLDY